MEECHSNNGKCCCCDCHSCNTQNESCHHHDEDGHEEFSSWLLEIADCAWREVLKDKIKEHILATQNEKMAELAKIVSEGNSRRWRQKMEKKQGCADFKEKLCCFFGQCKK